MSTRLKTGYEYEVEACVKAISQGWIECPEMPHSETLRILNMMDFIRKSNNIVFPGELKESETQEPEALSEKESATQEPEKESVEQKTETPTENAPENKQAEDRDQPVTQNSIKELSTALGLLTEGPAASEGSETAEQSDGSEKSKDTE